MIQPNVVNLFSQEVAEDEGYELMVVVNYRIAAMNLNSEYHSKKLLLPEHTLTSILPQNSFYFGKKY